MAAGESGPREPATTPANRPGYQGELLEKEHRNTEALEASRKVTLPAAQKLNAPQFIDGSGNCTVTNRWQGG